MKITVNPTVKNSLPISKKAYTDFSGRLSSTFEAIGSARVGEEAVNLLDAYLRGDDSGIMTVDVVVKIAFMMIKPEIDKAMRRSAAARERARRRREKANAATEQPITEQPVIEPSIIEPSAVEEPQIEKAVMNRRERRKLAHEQARVQRRHARRMMRLKKEREKSDRLCLGVGYEVNEISGCGRRSGCCEELSLAIA